MCNSPTLSVQLFTGSTGHALPSLTGSRAAILTSMLASPDWRPMSAGRLPDGCRQADTPVWRHRLRATRSSTTPVRAYAQATNQAAVQDSRTANFVCLANIPPAKPESSATQAGLAAAHRQEACRARSVGGGRAALPASDALSIPAHSCKYTALFTTWDSHASVLCVHAILAAKRGARGAPVQHGL
jgi:hypothetical protein